MKQRTLHIVRFLGVIVRFLGVILGLVAVTYAWNKFPLISAMVMAFMIASFVGFYLWKLTK